MNNQLSNWVINNMINDEIRQHIDKQTSEFIKNHPDKWY